MTRITMIIIFFQEKFRLFHKNRLIFTGNT
jgi:hypothetical protein